MPDVELKRLASAEFTRPADTTAYTAGDVVGPATTPAVLTLTRAAAHGGAGGEVVQIVLSKSTSTVTNATFRVHFYREEPTAIADNSAWTLLYTDRDKYLGYRDLDIAVSPGSGNGAVAQMASTHEPLAFVSANGEAGKLYAVIAAVGAYTPASGETFALSVTVKRYR